MSRLLNSVEIQASLQQLATGWDLQDNVIQRQCKFKDFIAAVEFVNQLVEPAEQAGHHPDLTISYNRVGVSLTTHDAGGLTQKDFDLAQQIDRLL
ncbi:MAG: 4a-hydroxytetrahydrobiopterin dehydratase [Cyanobacteria bacterium J06641_5]